MLFLNTRIRPLSPSSEHHLKRLQVESHHLPLLTIQPANCHQIARFNAIAWHLYDALVFTSPPSVEAALAIRPLPTYLPYFAMGPQTQQALKQIGIEAVAPQQIPGTLALAKQLTMQLTGSKSLLIVTGSPINPLLEDALVAANFAVHCVDLYTRLVDPDQTINIKQTLKNAQSCVLLITSMTTLNAIAHALPSQDHIDHCTLLVISDRLAKAARTYWRGRLHIAADASDAALIAAIESLGPFQS